MMASLEGRRGVPRRRLIHLSERGLWGRPTNLNNVETWANVPQIVLQRRRLVPRHRHRGLARAPRSSRWSAR